MRKEITEVRCDRCGDLMKDPHTIEIKNAFGPALTIMRLTDTWHYLDLCPKCCDSFIDWWRKNKK